jgi:hypothetical protein
MFVTARSATAADVVEEGGDARLGGRDDRVAVGPAERVGPFDGLDDVVGLDHRR